MKKLLQALVCGIAAVSFSAIAADEKKSTDAKAGASADVKADKKVKGKAAAGGTAGTKAENDRDVKVEGGVKTEAAPAPAPTPTPTK